MSIRQRMMAEEIIRLYFYSDNHTYNWFIVDKEKLKLPSIPLDEFNKSKPYIKEFLIDEGYMRKTKFTTLDFYTLTEKGIGFDSFENEYKKQQKEKRINKIKSLPQRYWYIVMILTALIAPTLVELIRVKLLEPTTQLQQAIPTLTDSVSNHKIDDSLKR
jgi:hypothetical protein